MVDQKNDKTTPHQKGGNGDSAKSMFLASSFSGEVYVQNESE